MQFSEGSGMSYFRLLQLRREGLGAWRIARLLGGAIVVLRECRLFGLLLGIGVRVAEG